VVTGPVCHHAATGVAGPQPAAGLQGSGQRQRTAQIVAQGVQAAGGQGEGVAAPGQVAARETPVGPARLPVQGNGAARLAPEQRHGGPQLPGQGGFRNLQVARTCDQQPRRAQAVGLPAPAQLSVEPQLNWPQVGVQAVCAEDGGARDVHRASPAAAQREVQSVERALSSHVAADAVEVGRGGQRHGLVRQPQTAPERPTESLPLGADHVFRADGSLQVKRLAQQVARPGQGSGFVEGPLATQFLLALEPGVGAEGQVVVQLRSVPAVEVAGLQVAVGQHAELALRAAHVGLHGYGVPAVGVNGHAAHALAALPERFAQRREQRAGLGLHVPLVCFQVHAARCRHGAVKAGSG